MKKDLKLRWYQVEAITACMDYLTSTCGKKNPLIVCPTGSGKSIIIAKIAELIQNIVDREPDAVIMVLSHVKEIVEQDAEELTDLLGIEMVGVYSSGLKRKERRQVTVAGIQSVYKKAHLFKRATHIIVDEAHLIPPDGEGMYHTFIDAIDAPVIGLTATPFRLGSGYLHKGKNKLFDKLVYDVDIVKLIQQGHLSPLLTKGSKHEMSTEGIKKIGNEFSSKQLEEKFDKFEKTRDIVGELVKYKEERKSWLLFAIGIEHAEHIAEQLRALGVKAEAVHSKISAENRAYRVRLFKEGRLQCLVSVATLTTGFNHPAVDLIGLVRPTNSPVLHVQMIGRGLRTAEGKEDCLVLDFAGNIMRLGPINAVHVAEKGKGGKGDAPVKCCPDCDTHVPASATRCYICGHEFPINRERKLSTTAHVTEAVKIGSKPTWQEVKKVLYQIHHGPKGESLKVTYVCGMRMFNEWVAIGRGGRAGYNSEHWWTYRSKWKNHPDYWPPKNVRDALKRASRGELNEPTRILINENGKYPNIGQHIFGGEAQVKSGAG